MVIERNDQDLKFKIWQPSIQNSSNKSLQGHTCSKHVVIKIVLEETMKTIITKLAVFSVYTSITGLH